MRPSTYYKYLPPERADVLRDLRIRFTQVSALNDPFESLPGVLLRERNWYLEAFRARAEREMRQRGIHGDDDRERYWREREKHFDHFHKCYTDTEWLESVCEEVQRMSDSLQGCLSLSATSTNILMWSHYARHHTGYVLGFHAEHEYFGESVDRVVYAETRPPYNPFESRHSGEVFYTKSTDWAYEQEYRKYQSFVEPIRLRNGNYLSPYTEPQSPSPLNEAIIVFPVPADAVASVILGWKPSPELRESVTHTLAAQKLAHVPIYCARPSLTRYEMEISSP